MTPLLALFDSLNYLAQNERHVVLPSVGHQDDFNYSLRFLRSYVGSLGTFNSYRREVERLLQWTWLIKKSTLPGLKRDDIEQFIRFCQNPPLQWISLKKVPRFLSDGERRVPNPQWRPFVATLSKAALKQGQQVDIQNFSLSQGATQEIFAILSTFFNFLIAEDYLLSNPVSLIRQKSKFIRKRQQNAPVRRLSAIQWHTVLAAAEQMAADDPEKHERTRFMMSLLFGMYLRISELAASERWVPSMNDFAKDSNGCWWFTTVGKGNKERQIAVSEDMLASLMRWRRHLGLSVLPTPADNSPLLPKIRGHGPMSDTAPLRRIVQACFDEAARMLKQQGHFEEAENLNVATVHWLRHTGISEDVKLRPREHVRDDAGHSSSVTTDRYIDVEMKARHASARTKTLVIDESS
ncbi:MAG: site-specific integrase [Legionellaceae bacterium]|nr:site-specific integrase [Legionellaceae bacterium]